jgi:hypothetical protein
MPGTVKKLVPPSLFYLISISSNYLYPYEQHVSVYIHTYIHIEHISNIT